MKLNLSANVTFYTEKITKKKRLFKAKRLKKNNMKFTQTGLDRVDRLNFGKLEAKR